MTELIKTVAVATGVFAGTNIDDIVVLTLLFLSARAVGKPRPWQIWAGQYIGMGILVAVSAAAAIGLTIVPDQWIGLLGLLPLGLGIRGLIGAIRVRGHADAAPAATATGLLSVAGVTIANGADNISVYTPLFRSTGPTHSLIAIAVFAVAVAVWCLAGSWLGSHKKIIAVIQRRGRWIVPAVFIAIGTTILATSGVIGHIINTR